MFEARFQAGPGQELVCAASQFIGNSSPGTMTSGADVHHLRVEYFDNTGEAAVSLRASLDGAAPAAIPWSLLRYPGDDVDEADPCAS